MKATKTLAAALLAGSLPLFAGAAVAAPLGQGNVLKNTDISSVEQVQVRRWKDDGPYVTDAPGAVIGGVVGPRAYDDGYDSYAYAPGYAGPGFRPAPRRANPWGNCLVEEEARSAYADPDRCR